jgi:thiaminase (transcriptional activator TenA)
MTPDYGRAFALWRDAAGAEWSAYTGHRFVQALGGGTLPEACFLHYMRQDYVFLIHFARAWALAAVKAGTLAEIRAASATVQALLAEEMPLHVRSCAALGIGEAELEATREAPENLAYTRYVLEAGYSGDFADLMAALAPCVLGYGEIGARLAGEAGGTRYRDWIDAYGGRDYQALCAEVGALIDGALHRRIGPDWQAAPRWPELCTRFATATRLEVGFWDMGLRPG